MNKKINEITDLCLTISTQENGLNFAFYEYSGEENIFGIYFKKRNKNDDVFGRETIKLDSEEMELTIIELDKLINILKTYL